MLPKAALILLRAASQATAAATGAGYQHHHHGTHGPQKDDAAAPPSGYGPGPPPPIYVTHPGRAEAVKQAFRISWEGYYKYAFPHDSYRPINKSYADDRLAGSLPCLTYVNRMLILDLLGVATGMDGVQVQSMPSAQLW